MSRIRRAAVLTAVVGAATVALAAPASAEPAVDSWQYCTESLHGAVLCLTATPDATGASAQVVGSLNLEPGRTFNAATIQLIRCQDVEPYCETVSSLWRSRSSGPFDELVTEPSPLDDDFRYHLIANWNDDQGHAHIGVRVETPEIPPEW